MERDELKDIWKQTFETGEHATDIESVYTAKSASLVDKILSTMKKEQRLNYILFPIIIIAFGVLGHYWLLALSLFLAGGTILYYKTLIEKLSKISIEHSVSNYLKESYHAILIFRRHYLTVGIIMFLVGFYMGSSAVSDIMQGDYENLTKLIVALLIMAVLALVIVGGIFYLLYGKNIAKLKKSIEGLESDA